MILTTRPITNWNGPHLLGQRRRQLQIEGYGQPAAGILHTPTTTRRDPR